MPQVRNVPQVREIVIRDLTRDSRMPPRGHTSHFFIFGAAISLGAFLLFEVQLILGKYILPWFGGMPSVWTTCMLVFQVFLLLGYLYAHVLTTWIPTKTSERAAFCFAGLLAGAAGLVSFSLEDTDHAWGWVEAVALGRSHMENHPASGRVHRLPVFLAVDHRAACPKMVCARQSRRVSLSSIRLVECWFIARSVDISIPD